MTAPLADAARALRILHLAMLAGLLIAAGVFIYIVRGIEVRLDVPPVVAPLLTIVSIGLLGIAALFLRRRIPERQPGELPAAFWANPGHRGAAIILWAVTEGAALFGLIGYLVTAALLPAVGAGLAILAFTLFRPAALEGAA